MPSTPTLPAAHPSGKRFAATVLLPISKRLQPLVPAVATVGIEPATSEAGSHGKETECAPRSFTAALAATLALESSAGYRRAGLARARLAQGARDGGARQRRRRVRLGRRGHRRRGRGGAIDARRWPGAPRLRTLTSIDMNAKAKQGGTMRVLKLFALLATLTVAPAAAAQEDHGAPSDDDERPSFNLNVVLRPAAGGPDDGFGFVKFRQPKDPPRSSTWTSGCGGWLPTTTTTSSGRPIPTSTTTAPARTGSRSATGSSLRRSPRATGGPVEPSYSETSRPFRPARSSTSTSA